MFFPSHETSEYTDKHRKENKLQSYFGEDWLQSDKKARSLRGLAFFSGNSMEKESRFGTVIQISSLSLITRASTRGKSLIHLEEILA